MSPQAELPKPEFFAPLECLNRTAAGEIKNPFELLGGWILLTAVVQLNCEFASLQVMRFYDNYTEALGTRLPSALLYSLYAKTKESDK